jgi:hypothetical protein
MSELFEIKETKSPRLLWMDKHGVWTEKTKFVDFDQPEHAWTATAAGQVGVGPTEDDAIVDLAKHMGIKLWNEL